MPRIRTIKPEFWESEKVGSLSTGARLLFVGLISQADDEGRGRGSDRYLTSRLFPYDDPRIIRHIRRWVSEISEVGLAVFYDGKDGCRYYQLEGFKEHQKIDRAKESKLPAPPKSTKRRGKSPKRERRIRDQGSGKGKDQGSGKARDDSTNQAEQLAEIYEKAESADGDPLTPLRSAINEFKKALGRGISFEKLKTEAAAGGNLRVWQIVKKVVSNGTQKSVKDIVLDA